MTLNANNRAAVAGGLFSCMVVFITLFIFNELNTDIEMIFGREVRRSWLITLGIIGGLMILSYIIATVSVKSDSGNESGLTGFFRGFQIALNSAANAGLIWWLLGSVLSNELATGIALGVGGLTLLACIAPVSQSGFYQGVLGYLNWLLPMSWPIIALGFVFLLISVLLCWIPSQYFRFQDAGMDPKTCTFFVKGGLFGSLNPNDTAYNMGNFAFVDHLSPSMYKDHEAGHTLNLAVFGSIFHLLGALQQIFDHEALSELLAESNAPSGSDPKLLMWS
jgi:hypothetical protein